jgi:hypothetical protein
MPGSANRDGRAPQAAAALGGPNIYVDSQPQEILQTAEVGGRSWRVSSHLAATVNLRHYRCALQQSNSEYGLFTGFGAESNSTPYESHASHSGAGTVPQIDLR